MIRKWNWWQKTLAVIFTILSIIAVGLVWVINLPQFGSKPSGQHLAAISNSTQYAESNFQNPTAIDVHFGFDKIVQLMGAYTESKEGMQPSDSLPILHPDLNLLKSSPETFITWFGHSAFMLEMEGKLILLDPMLGAHASPFSFQIRRFRHELPIEVEDFPAIDVVVFSHDHYDHLDYNTILKLKDRVKHFIVPLGLGSHLIHWGVKQEQITELDWGESTAIEGIQYHCTPSQHFSGRSVNDRNSTLWSSWVIEGKEKKIFFSGDSGFFPGFKKIGEEFGPFDLALLECGQYNLMWKEIHMLPEETAQAAVDLNAKRMIPIHWGMFELSLHPWKEPVERVTKQAKVLEMPITIPMIGERFNIDQPPVHNSWWEEVE